MGSTPIHGIPFADPTDLVRDWPALSEDVALAIEAALENIPVTQKKIEAFTGDGTWTVPAGVTYAIAHMRGGGGGGLGSDSSGTDGGASSVDFASGLVSAAGGPGGVSGVSTPAANSGSPGEPRTDTAGNGLWSAQIVAGSAVTPAEVISVTVGAGGAGGSGDVARREGSPGGSGYVYIEYFEEV